MNVFNSLDNLPKFGKTIFTQGTFDGVHLGHQKILSKLAAESKEKGLESVLMTFWPHPRLLLYPDDNQLKLLQSLPEKLDMLQQCGVDNVIVIPFDKAFSNLTAAYFVEEILVNKINVASVIFGYDHRFGKGREGDIKLLKQQSRLFDFNVIEIGVEEISDIAISSTKIRQALTEGLIEKANSYLGRYYSLRGAVVEGLKIGRTIGFPTANIKTDIKEKLLPSIGVYLVYSILDGVKVYGMANIGNNPTIKDKGFSIEVHYIDYQSDLYNKEIEVFFINRLRDEIKFENLEELSLFLQLDKKNALDKIKSL